MKYPTLAMVLACSLVAHVAAQDDDAARARALFSQGVTTAGEHHYAEAATLFRQALALHDAPAIRYNLASTLFEQQQYTEAHELASALLAQADLAESVRTPTEALEVQIASAAALVTFTLPAGVSAEVQVDDAPVADPSRTTALAPGHHVARAVSGGSTIAQASFDVAAAEHRAVELTPEPTAPVASPVSSASRPVTEEWWFWTIIGVGALAVVGVGVGVGVAVDQGNHSPVTGNFTPGIISW